ncbi:MAG: PAS domain-containing protein [Nitrosomonas sp.]|nr:PAS domain-containing protein [Nitrosomonas sp.]
MIVLILDDSGKICECNQMGEELLECLPSELIGQPISRALPELADTKQFQAMRGFPELSNIGPHFKAVRKFGTRFAGNVFFIDAKNMRGQRMMRVIICPAK